MSGWPGGLFRRWPRASAEQASQMMRQGAILLDVREGPLPARMKDLPPQRTVVTVCRSGHRSALAARMLALEGREVINLSGGMHAWARARLPVVATGGRPGRVA